MIWLRRRCWRWRAHSSSAPVWRFWLRVFEVGWSSRVSASRSSPCPSRRGTRCARSAPWSPSRPSSATMLSLWATLALLLDCEPFLFEISTRKQLSLVWIIFCFCFSQSQTLGCTLFIFICVAYEKTNMYIYVSKLLLLFKLKINSSYL